MSNENINKIDNEFAYDELGIIIEQQAILQQKVSILIGINTGLLVILLSVCFAYDWPLWSLFLIIGYSIPPILINVYIMFPQFKSGNSKYFYDFADMNDVEIEKYILENKNNVYKQIEINSKITKNKYNKFKHALAWTLLFFPYLFLIRRKKK